MKKTKSKYILGILLFALMLCGCSKDNRDAASNVTSDGNSDVNLTVTPTEDNTKADPSGYTVTPTGNNNVADTLVCAVAEPETIEVKINRNFTPGLMEQLKVTVSPKNAYGRLEFTSSDENVAVVNRYGVVTALKAGEATITATALNGVSASCTIVVNSNYAELSFELTADGTGYVVTGCDKKALTANIPATYNGKPVKEIGPRAFIECSGLSFFTTDPDQEYFYAIDGVLYTDKPEKTLVRMPNAYTNQYQPICTYTVLPDTKAIGDYAFAGYTGTYNGLSVFLPDGLTTMGDGVFCEVVNSIEVYAPDSLETIGQDITLNQYANVPFYGSWDSYAATYCREHNIPFGGYYYPEVDYSKEAEIFVPVSAPADGYVVPEESQIAYVEPQIDALTEWYHVETIKISGSQKLGKEEVRILFESVWQDRIVDKNGNKSSNFPAMTGVYGMGYTKEPCKLVAYAIDGKPIATMDVAAGDFVFSFKGAANLGVVGGKDTVISALPNEPMFVKDSGYVNMKPEIWNTTDYGTGYKTIITCYANGNFSMEFPQTINCVSYTICDSVGSWDEQTTHFNSVTLSWNDNTRMDRSDLWHVHCAGIDKIYESSTLECYAKETVTISPDYGNQVEKILETLKETMIGNYYPEDIKIKKIGVRIDGDYPASGSSILYLDDNCADVSGCISTYTHELVHAIDQSIRYCDTLAPSPWLEGRAEYISRIANEKLGEYGPYYEEKGDWDFLTEHDKADFLHYYCLNNNRETPYYVGYYFIKYLNETYGDDITAKIMEAMSKVEVPANYYDMSDEKRMNMFGDIVKAATCETVFQDFVRDVVEK